MYNMSERLYSTKNLFCQVLFSIFIILIPFIGSAADIKRNLEDSVITGLVKSKMAGDRDISSSDISVTTEGGVVYLNGQVDTVSQAERAVELASSVEDVTDVNTDHLAIKDSSQAIKDSYITAKVQGVLLREELLHKNDHFKDVKVETKNGVVHLSGHVPSKANAEKAVNLASDVKGARKVVSHIRVE